jgi:nucleoside-diphosphate-sugar epimerase
MTVSGTVRRLLLAPDRVARAAALAAQRPEQRWMLCQSRDVRRSYVAQVVDRPEDPDAEQRWMLHQPDEVRMSYVREVLDAS